MIAHRGATIAFALLLLMLFATNSKAEEPVLTLDEIYVAQTILFENGFTELGFPDGIIGQKTRLALRNWQEKSGLPITGELNKETVDALVKAGFPQDFVWGAVSISMNGEVSAVTKYKSGIQAYRDAANTCQQLSGLADECVTVAIYTLEPMETWIAGYYCVDEDYDAYITIAPGADRRHAMQLAYEGILERPEFQPWECDVGAAISVSEDYGTTPAAMRGELRDEEIH